MWHLFFIFYQLLVFDSQTKSARGTSFLINFRQLVLPSAQIFIFEPMNFSLLRNALDGELFTDQTTRRLYATDASAYREVPIAVAFPKTEEDIAKLIRFAGENKTSLIPRTAGTSLAGQVVGGGIVVD